MASPQWRFDDFHLDPDNACLWRGTQPLALTPKAFDVLHYLVTHPDRLVTKDMVKNKSPFSREFGNGAVVPLGQVIIKNDLHVLFEIGSVFAPRFIHLVQNPYR